MNSETKRTMEWNYECQIAGIDKKDICLSKFNGYESLYDSECIHHPLNLLEHADRSLCFTIDLVSSSLDRPPTAFLDQEITLSLYLDQVCHRQINGIIHSCSYHRQHQQHHYQVVMVSKFSRLAHNQQSRIFTQQSAQQIIASICQHNQLPDYQFLLHDTPLERAFCMQYQESDLAFIDRLAAEEGWIRYISQQQGKHLLIFTDRLINPEALPTELNYQAENGLLVTTPVVKQLHRMDKVHTNHVELNPIHLQNPNTPLNSSRLNASDGQPTLSHYEIMGRYQEPAQGQRKSQFYLDYLQREKQLVIGKGDHPGLQLGQAFTLSPSTSTQSALLYNQHHWTPVILCHYGAQAPALSRNAVENDNYYYNHFICTPSTQPWRSHPHQRTLKLSTLIAQAIGPQPDELYCDSQGRVQLAFPWQQDNQQSTSHGTGWVHVSTRYAGAQYGQHVLPRVGNHVVVTFRDGDPDLPIVTHSYYHSQQPALLTPAQLQGQTTWRSQTPRQQRQFNALTFDDHAQAELIAFQAQKDMQIKAPQDMQQMISGQHRQLIQQDEILQTQHDQHQQLQGNQKMQVTNTLTVAIDQSLHQQAGQNHCIEATTDLHYLAHNKMITEAKTICLQVSGNGVTINQSGISFFGTGLQLNTGSPSTPAQAAQTPTPRNPQSTTASIAAGEQPLIGIPTDSKQSPPRLSLRLDNQMMQDAQHLGGFIRSSCLT